MKIINFFIFIWQLPQHLLAMILIGIYSIKIKHITKHEKSNVFFIEGFPAGISLGKYIIINFSLMSSNTVVKHEYGHSIQSKILGPLYLLIVGLPSITFNVLTRLGKLDRRTYYNRFPENWADKLGGVKR